METLRKAARTLLEEGAVAAVIGYEAGSKGRARMGVATRPEDTERLVFDERCLQNLAVYLHKHEVRALGRLALVARGATLRTLLQLASEKHLPEDLVVLAVSGDTVERLEGAADIEAFVAAHPEPPPGKVRERVAEIDALAPAERWAFWQEALSECVKCYACRSSCPMCYCDQCLTECNRPQWIPVPAHALGNFEWHVSRAMHLAGRCVGCGDCARACPVGIPVDLLNAKVGLEVMGQFGHRAGTSASAEYPFSHYADDDRESFIR